MTIMECVDMFEHKSGNVKTTLYVMYDLLYDEIMIYPIAYVDRDQVYKVGQFYATNVPIYKDINTHGKLTKKLFSHELIDRDYYRTRYRTKLGYTLCMIDYCTKINVLINGKPSEYYLIRCHSLSGYKYTFISTDGEHIWTGFCHHFILKGLINLHNCALPEVSTIVPITSTKPSLGQLNPQYMPSQHKDNLPYVNYFNKTTDPNFKYGCVFIIIDFEQEVDMEPCTDALINKCNGYDCRDFR